ncbi:hypothetical protein LTR85_008788 [Meristemomyces frigidus]|nr:hypothetical protein LTR85_008788 [Meristemomyces frigidus]
MALQDVDDQLPLQGVVLCCTALAQDVRTKLADTVTQMGAIFKLDLTCDVTHLIVGSITTPKYRYVAKDRPDIKVLDNDWVEAVRQTWMKGEEVNVEELEEMHRFGTFAGLKICITGFDDLDQRSHISDTAKSNGAEYHPDLTKAVTHLIAAAPQGAKYTHAKSWGISIVSLKWLDDSIQRGLALEEALYDPVLPVEEQGRGAFRTEPKPRTSLGKRTRESESQGAEEAGKRKLRRTASTRLHSQSQDMWQGISAREAGADTPETDAWRDESEAGSREQSLQPRRASNANVQVRRSGVFDAAETETAPEGLFSGRYVLIRGFPREKASRLQQFLEPNGACVVKSAVELEHASHNLFFKSRHLLVPHALSNGPLEVPEVAAGTELVTEWWVERCIHYKRYFEPEHDALSRPLWNAIIPSFAGVTICTTGFPGVDFRQIAEAVKLLGAAYEEKLKQHVSVLISGSDTVKKEKAYYAAKHSIPVVSADWLWECLKLKRRVAYDDFKIKLPAFDPKEFVREPSTSSPAPSDMLQSRSGRLDTVRKDDAASKRLTNTRLKRATPSLSLQATKPALAPAARRPGPFVHEDDEPETPDIDHVPEAAPSPRRSQVLQELSPNRSPRKASQEMSVGDEEPESVQEVKPIVTHSEPSPMPVTAPQSPKSPRRSPSKNIAQPPPVRPQEELTANLAALLQQQMASRPDSAGSDVPQKRKNRPLGRSASGIGNRSASASAQSEHNGGSPALPSEVSDSVADGYTFSSRETPLPPSTQLGYGAVDGEAHTMTMEKRMKVKVHDENGGKRPASIGTVKDSTDGDTGVGNRVRGRHRTKT